MKFFKAILNYLKDWKNLLAHTIIGVLILLVALYLPVTLYARMIILVLVVVFNILRMRRNKMKQKMNNIS